MPQNNRHVERSSEAQEILGRMPSWIIRWGIVLIFTIFSGIITGCWFIKYPQVVTSDVIITTINPPADLIARTTGRIDTIFVTQGAVVCKDEIIALLYNTADFRAVCAISDSLNCQSDEVLINSSWVGQEYPLGELQASYADFSRTCLDYRDYLKLAYIDKKLELLGAQIAKNREYYKKLLSQKVITDRDMTYEKKNLKRDSSLFKSGVLSEADYELSQRALLQKQSSQTGFEASLKSTELDILQMEQQLIELAIQKQNETAEYDRRLSQAKQQLSSEIAQWRYQYVIASSIAGTITFTKYWSNNQTMQTGERLASIIPSENMQVLGRLMIPSSGFGKVKKGQTVNIKLNGYPYMEFGQLKGEIINISEVPEKSEDGVFYTAEVAMPSVLTTTYHKDLKLIQQMDGTAEIITQDQRLIQRFLQPIRALFDK